MNISLKKVFLLFLGVFSFFFLQNLLYSLYLIDYHLVMVFVALV